MAGGAASVEGINVWGNGIVNFLGGYITGGISECAGARADSRGICAWENSTVNIYGGNITGGEADSAGYPAYSIGINSMGNSKVNIYGGYISAGVASSTPEQAHSIGIVAVDSSIVTIYGKDFNFDYGSINNYSGSLTGTLSDGTYLNIRFQRQSVGQIILSPIPEPTTLLLFGLGAAVIRKFRA